MSEIETMLRKIFRTLIQAKRMKVTDREFDSEYRKLVHNAGIIPKDEADKWLSRAKEVALSMGKSFNYIDWLELLFSSEE
jgi:FKBP-type peptidyl-prolyl cis-trans isomerase (trigger factor)